MCIRDRDGIALADTGLDLYVCREGCAAVANNTCVPDCLDALVVGHCLKILRLDRLVQSVLMVILDVYKRQQ